MWGAANTVAFYIRNRSLRLWMPRWCLAVVLEQIPHELYLETVSLGTVRLEGWALRVSLQLA